jgi:arsenate reductase
VRKPTVLIICKGNSVRSQMAEGILKSVSNGLLNVKSGGSQPRDFVDPLAIQVLKEIGIDISSNTSKNFKDLLDEQIDIAITVCNTEDCPLITGVKKALHWEFQDPGDIAPTEDLKIQAFRNIRDQIHRVFTAFAEGFTLSQVFDN